MHILFNINQIPCKHQGNPVKSDHLIMNAKHKEDKCDIWAIHINSGVQIVHKVLSMTYEPSIH